MNKEKDMKEKEAVEKPLDQLDLKLEMLMKKYRKYQPRILQPIYRNLMEVKTE